MSESTVQNSLAYYAAHGAALFPIPAGQKIPGGLVQSFKHDFSTDPAQWLAWSAAYPGCNFGVVAFASNWIIADVDTSGGEAGRVEAWQMWCELCASWGVAPLAPHVQSARGGWHFYFQVPDGVDASTLRQPDAIKGRINIRCIGYVVAAGSYYDGTTKGEESGPYVLLSDAAPHPAPDALVRHCTRVARPAARSSNLGTRDKGDVAALLQWLNERGAFADYESWFQVGMALKIEFGDDGLALWQLTHDDTVDADTECAKWDSFSHEPTGNSVTLNSFLQRAHVMGWRGTVRKSTSAMFDGVQAIAAAAGATLPAGTPMPASGGVPMLGGQEALADFAGPVLAEFLSITADAPLRPLSDDFPTLPDAVAGHGLFIPLKDCIARIVAMAESPSSFKGNRCIDPLAILSLVHLDVFESVCRRIRTLGCTLPDRKIKLAATAFADKVERVFVKQDNWEYDLRGEPQGDNSDNVAVFLGIIGAEIRWNAWLERAEIRGGSGLSNAPREWPDWSYVDDTVVAKLRTRGNRTKTRFRPGKDFFYESLLALAHQFPHDPARIALDDLAASWDQTPRLAIWLSAVCGVPCDPYHQAVSKNIIGGIVRRIRQPGCKHDTMAVLFGPQGTGKSTIAQILALEPSWFTDNVLLGDSAKELVLSLAGKCVAEIGEMGMRGNTNAAHVKAMISRQTDAGRTAYARAVSERPRRNIFIGTTNDANPLEDPTGNRRFLPVCVEQHVDLAWLRANIGQLIGEAAILESAGATFALPADVWGIAAEHQENARTESDIETMLADWFATTPMTEGCTWISGADLVQLSSLSGWRNGGATAARSAIMKRLGFRIESTTLNGKRTKIWARKSDSVRPADIPRIGVRYVVTVDSHGRASVGIRSTDAPRA